ncbi:MAG TPA: hypothetical protein VFK57_05815 [Vicinamibacterales bacterium]|nr:hypothetical protein [Vicinamibacterales bacterium]
MTPRPPLLLCLLYLAPAHVALALAFGGVALDPAAATGFFYHSRMLAIVHLVTLGWITASILGALYIVGPAALRTWFRAGWLDYTAAAFVWIGVTGMVAHFWIVEYRGMAWSAAMVTIGIAAVGIRVAPPLWRAPIPAAVRTHILLAFVNIAGAAVMGVLLGINKVHPFLPGFVLNNVFAHAHLAAVGWAAMMVVGVAYRLLPMVLPSQMPAGRSLWATAVLLQAGALGLFVALLLRAPVSWIFAVMIVAGFATFLGHGIWMVRHPRPRPPAIPVPETTVLHAVAAGASLAIACGLGLWLSVAELSPQTLRVAIAYGVFGLVGFLSQMVVAMKGRLLPLFAWYWASARSGGVSPVPSPHEMPWRGGQELVFVLWLFGVPALAGGLAFDAVPFVRAAAWSLLAATLLDSAQAAIILRHAFRAAAPLGRRTKAPAGDMMGVIPPRASAPDTDGHAAERLRARDRSVLPRHPAVPEHRG